MEFTNRNPLHDFSKFQGLEQVVNVTTWQKEDKPYEEGARDKFVAYCPDSAPFPFLIPRHRYLFKQSDKKYPGDFLVEILAYRIGVRMGIPVVPVFVAIDDAKRKAGALSEWFYAYPGSQHGEKVAMGGDILQNLIAGYDRDKGTQHNFTDIDQIFGNFINMGVLSESAQEIGLKILIFDTFIGNGDRHQDNWAFVSKNAMFLAPAFDNGSAMGHELLEDRLSTVDIDAYIRKGRHHMKFNRDDKKKVPHLTLIKHVMELFPNAQEILRQCLAFDVKDIESDMKTLKIIQDALPYNENWLTEARLDFMTRLFARRYELLKELAE